MQARKSWFIVTAVGLAEAIFAILLPDQLWFQLSQYDLGGILTLLSGTFAAVFAYAMRVTFATTWWRALLFIVVFVAANISAFLLAFGVYYSWISPFVYGFVLALIVCATTGLLIPAARDWRAGLRTVFATGLMAGVYWPLNEIFPNFVISFEAVQGMFGLVHATIAASFGWQFFRKTPKESC